VPHDTILEVLRAGVAAAAPGTPVLDAPGVCASVIVTSISKEATFYHVGIDRPVRLCVRSSRVRMRSLHTTLHTYVIADVALDAQVVSPVADLGRLHK
jgi:hypothetical protein